MGNPHDPVAISFWIISIAMVAATVFFLMESMAVGAHWKTSMNVGALVTLVAAVHYFYMREYWVQLGKSPIVYRYIDWSITVPLQMIEIYSGEAGKVASSGGKVGEHVRSSFETMRFIVSVGWSIYPLGYFFGYLCGSVSDEALNVVYNIADVINK